MATTSSPTPFVERIPFAEITKITWDCFMCKEGSINFQNRCCPRCGRLRCQRCRVKRVIGVPTVDQTAILPSSTTRRPRQRQNERKFNRDGLFVRPGRFRDLRLKIGGIDIVAVPDSGAHINALPFSTFKRLPLRIQEREPPCKREDNSGPIRTARGSNMHSLFQVTLPCQLGSYPSGPTEEFPVVFHVFTKLATGVEAIVGCDVLCQAEIFTKQKHLLLERCAESSRKSRCMSLVQDRPFYLGLQAFVNGNYVMANADTGSDVNLVSKRFVVNHRIFTESVSSAVNGPDEVEFVDGGVAHIREKATMQISLNAPGTDELLRMINVREKNGGDRGWRGGQARVTEAQAKALSTFYVVESLVHEVIFSQDLLDSIDAFRDHASPLELVPSNPGCLHLCTIFRTKKQRAKVFTSSPAHDRVQREVARRHDVAQKREMLCRKLEKVPTDTSDTSERDKLMKRLEELRIQDLDDRSKYEAEKSSLGTKKDAAMVDSGSMTS